MVFPWFLIALTCSSLPLISLYICALSWCSTYEIIKADAGDFPVESSNGNPSEKQLYVRFRLLAERKNQQVDFKILCSVFRNKIQHAI